MCAPRDAFYHLLLNCRIRLINACMQLHRSSKTRYESLCGNLVLSFSFHSSSARSHWCNSREIHLMLTFNRQKYCTECFGILHLHCSISIIRPSIRIIEIWTDIFSWRINSHIRQLAFVGLPETKQLQQALSRTSSFLLFISCCNFNSGTLVGNYWLFLAFNIGCPHHICSQYQMHFNCGEFWKFVISWWIFALHFWT